MVVTAERKYAALWSSNSSLKRGFKYLVSFEEVDEGRRIDQNQRALR